MVSKKAHIPERGDIVWVTLSPTRGHEQSGRRPVLILSPAFYNKSAGTALICPITSKQKGYAFEVLFSANKISGTILADQIRVVDWKARKITLVDRVGTETVDRVLEKIILLIKNE